MQTSRSPLGRLVLPLIAFAAAPLAAQTTHVVQGANLQTAIDAAAPGDILLVEGAYSGGSLTIAKPLHIHGRPGASISTIPYAPRIHSIPAGTSLVLQGFVFPALAVQVENCLGRVLLADVRATTTTGTVVRIVGCAEVAIDGCSFASGVEATTSTVLITRSTLTGPRGFGRLWIPSRPGLTLNGGRAMVVASRFTGGDGDNVFAPMPGILLAAASLRLSGGENRVTAGQYVSTAVDAVSGGGSAWYDPRTIFIAAGAGRAFGPSIVAATSHLPVTTINRTALGEIATVTIAGAPGQAFALLGVTAIPPLALPGIEGELWTAPSVLAVGALDALGFFSLAFRVPDVEVLRGILFRWQGVTSDGTTIRLGEPITESHR